MEWHLKKADEKYLNESHIYATNISSFNKTPISHILCDTSCVRRTVLTLSIGIL